MDYQLISVKHEAADAPEEYDNDDSFSGANLGGADADISRGRGSSNPAAGAGRKKAKLKEPSADLGIMSENQICVVCGDYASGFHYSALTCEACKSFFKRTVQDKHEYTCSGNFDCSVSKSMRKSCQYCRFQKCLMTHVRHGLDLDDTRARRRRTAGQRSHVAAARSVRPRLSMSPDAETFASDGFAPAAPLPHSREYQRTQLAFADAVESGQPDAWPRSCTGSPTTVDTLLQLAEVFRLQEDAATAADLVAARLFARRENRALFSALLRHALALTGRCCHRACLETCKLLLSLSPTADPMGSLLLIDAACLMSGQEEFLLRLLHAWEPSRHLTQLPNWAFSAALAASAWAAPDAAAALDAALIQFPSVLAPLLARLSVEAAPPVSGCRLFSAAEADRSRVRDFASSLRPLLEEAAAVTFLVSGAARVAEAAAATPPDPRIAEAAERATPPLPAHPAERPPAPGRLRGPRRPRRPAGGRRPAGLNAFDPLPPPDSVCAATTSTAAARLRRGAGGASAADDGLLTAFLRSLMPNFDPSAPPQPQGAEGGEGGGGGGLAGLLESVRQLLNGLGPPPPPFDEEAD
uniref:Nuclear receptor domain-containing protein n=1 Tax=Macrostomum lignano TaxID=282301 RepID=A0A1I8JPN1_9PLAT